jgi:hypothetical protein
MRFLLVLAAILAALGAVPAARADDDVRVRGGCTGPSQLRLRVRADDGRLRIELELTNRSSATGWRVVIVRERRLLWQGTVLTARRSTARVRRSAADWFGSDAVAVRAVSRRGEACRATATLP